MFVMRVPGILFVCHLQLIVRPKSMICTSNSDFKSIWMHVARQYEDEIMQCFCKNAHIFYVYNGYVMKLISTVLVSHLPQF